jgi:hypothetical protein
MLGVNQSSRSIVGGHAPACRPIPRSTVFFRDAAVTVQLYARARRAKPLEPVGRLGRDPMPPRATTGDFNEHRFGRSWLRQLTH